MKFYLEVRMQYMRVQDLLYFTVYTFYTVQDAKPIKQLCNQSNDIAL